MWDNLFRLIVKVTSLQPDYEKMHCIAYKQSTSACKVCQEVCPHEAISFKRAKEVQIDDVDCTGCGLCVQHCPSQALTAKTAFQTGAPIKCSKVKGSAQTVQCLGRLSVTDIVRLAGRKDKVSLVRGDCENCSIGSVQVVEVISSNVEKAQNLAALRQRELQLEVLELDKYDSTDNPDPISRRDLLRGGWRGIQSTAADTLAPLDPGDTEVTLPKEMQRQYAIIKWAEPSEDTVVPWLVPRVAEGCIMCPVCTNVCPTKAFSREFSPEGTRLMLEPERCNGCNACVNACPPKVISLEPVTWGELSAGKQEAYFRDPGVSSTTAVSR